MTPDQVVKPLSALFWYSLYRGAVSLVNPEAPLDAVDLIAEAPTDNKREEEDAGTLPLVPEHSRRRRIAKHKRTE
jgi:hypothetical protein